MNSEAHYQLTNKLEELKSLAVFIEDLGKQWGLSEKIGMNVNLVLEEIITNTIHYGYSDHLPHFITIDFLHNLKDNELKIIVADDGNPFNPYTAETPDVETTDINKRKVGGLGIYLVRQLMDSFEYEWKENRNVLTLKKNI